jgi:hypothetical protein
MSTEKRRAARKAFEKSAVMRGEAGFGPEPCTIRNISDTGARLACTAPARVPDRFVLQLSVDGKVIRKCQVVWRSGLELGVTFADS